MTGLIIAVAAALAQDDGAIVVRDSRSSAPDPSEVPASVTVIEVDEALPGASDVASVVDSASGTTVQRLGGLGDWSAVSIRGANLRHTQVYLDGVPLNPDGAEAVNLSELPLWAFERVEIYRGNAPPEFAAAPIGGVVNLVTGEGAADGVAASVSYGSFNTTRTTALGRSTGELLGRTTDTFVTAESFSTRGDYTYFADNGTEYNLLDDRVLTRTNNDKTQLSAHGRWRLEGDRLALSVLDAFLTREEGLPGHANNPAEQVRLSTRRNLSVLELSGGDAVATRARAWGFVRDEVFDDRAGEIGTGNQWLQSRFASVGVLTHTEWLASPYVVPAITASARRDGYAALNLLTGEQDPDRRRSSLVGGASADLYLLSDRLTIAPVVQVIWLDNRALGDDPLTGEPLGGGGELTYLHVNPRLGVLVSPAPGLALKANIGHYLRPPDFTEMFGDRGAVIGNPDLRPEEGLQWDVGGRWVLPEQRVISGSLELTHFWNYVTDLIVMIQNSQRTMVPVNLDDAWVQGVEAAASLSWFELVETQSNLTRNVSVNLSTDPAFSNKQLPRIPTWELYQRTALVWGEHLRLGHTFSYTDGNYWDRTNWYRATPRPIHGAFLRVQPGERAPSLELDVLNLTDRIVEVVPRNPLDPSEDDMVVQPITDFVGYPLPGRTLMLTARWER